MKQLSIKQYGDDSYCVWDDKSAFISDNLTDCFGYIVKEFNRPMVPQGDELRPANQQTITDVLHELQGLS